MKSSTFISMHNYEINSIYNQVKTKLNRVVIIAAHIYFKRHMRTNAWKFIEQKEKKKHK